MTHSVIFPIKINVQITNLVLHPKTKSFANIVVGFVLYLMVALWNRADHYIFALWFLLLSFFPHLNSAIADWMSAILPHMVWP